MKKMIILAAAVAMAAFANAAAVNWNSGAVYSPTDPTAKIGKQTGDWVMTIAFYTYDAVSSSYAEFAAGGDLSDNSTLAVSKFSGAATGFENNATYYAKAIITDKAGTWSITTDYVGFTMPTINDGSINLGDGTGLISATAAWDTTKTGAAGSTGVWTSTAVPEPTSGLLLLLGMAGLALKRKIA